MCAEWKALYICLSTAEKHLSFEQHNKQFDHQCEHSECPLTAFTRAFKLISEWNFQQPCWSVPMARCPRSQITCSACIYEFSDGFRFWWQIVNKCIRYKYKYIHRKTLRTFSSKVYVTLTPITTRWTQLFAIRLTQNHDVVSQKIVTLHQLDCKSVSNAAWPIYAGVNG